MELDDLKAVWQQEAHENLQFKKKNMEELQLILKEKASLTLTNSKSRYERIITMLLAGILLNIAINPFLHFLLGDDGPIFRLTFSNLLSLLTLVIICLVVIFFYWLKYRSIIPEITDNDIKCSLNKNITRLRKSLREEVFFIIMLFLITFVAGRAASQFLGNGDFEDIFHTDILLAMLAGFFVMAYYIYSRMNSYKNDISQLQQYLQELEDLN